MEGDVIIMNENGVINGQLVFDKIRDPEIIQGRWVRVAHSYIKTRQFIDTSFSICGLNGFKVIHVQFKFRNISYE